MPEEWGYFVNIDDNEEFNNMPISTISDEKKTNRRQLLDTINEYDYYCNNENKDYENQEENNYYKRQKSTIFILAKLLFKIYSFSIYMVESLKTIASKLSFSKNNQ